MLRLLYIPLDYHLETYREWYEAFSKHYEVKYYVSLEDAIIFKPHILLCHAGALSLNELKALRVNLASASMYDWTGDCREELLEPVMRGKNIFDATFMAAGIGQKDMYEKALGHPVHYLQHAVAADIQYSVRRNFLDKKITFIGNNYDQFEGARERNELCELLSKEYIDFKIYGNGYDDPKYNNCHSVHPTLKYQLYNESYVALSSNILNGIEGYWSDRPLEIMAAGSCCIMRYVPNLEKYFIDHKECFFYDSNTEALRIIRDLLSNEYFRNQVAAAGQKRVLSKHTYDNRVHEFIKAIQ